MFIILGLLIGFVAAIPLGPVNIFVISQAIKRGFFHGFLAGLTAGFLDFAFCIVAVMGIFHVAISYKFLLPGMKVLAALLLIAISLRLIKQARHFLEVKPRLQMNSYSTSHKPVLGVILLYVSNPTIYAFWIGIAGSASAHHWVANIGWRPIVFALSCGLGAAIWYFSLVRYLSRHHGRLQPKTFEFIVWILAIFLLTFAAFTLASIFFNIKTITI